MVGRIISHYRILEKLGEGGMGVVYKAEDLKLKRLVALKFLPQHQMSVEQRRRFLREAQAAAALEHPNICTIYEVDEVDEQAFFAMALVPGKPLSRHIDAGPLPVRTAVDIAVQVGEALAAAHEAGVVHRDIKAGNIMITPQERAVVLDFGLAQMGEGSRITRTGATVGTAAYMSPEQAQGAALDRRSDLWSLGVALYEMLTGYLPFRGDYELAVMYNIVNEDPTPLSQSRADAPEDLELILHTALAKDPDERYQNAGEMVSDLRAVQRMLHAADAPTQTNQASVARTRSKVRPGPSRKSVWALAGLAAAMISLGGWGVWQSRNGGSISLGSTIPHEKHLAVLPFENISGDPSGRALCDGLVETLSGKLTELEQFRDDLLVVPSSEVRAEQVASVSQARSLFGVNLAVTGSLQRAGNRLRLTANLVDAPSLRQLRSATLDLADEEISSLQDGVALRVIEMLELELDVEVRKALSEGAANAPQAYERYLEGRGYLQRYDQPGNVEAAISALQRAIEADGGYAPAYAALGDAYWRRFAETRNQEWADKALQSAQQAVELNPRLAVARVTLGDIYRRTSQQEKAVEQFERALELDPLNADARSGLARVYLALGRDQEAEALYRKAVQMRPDDWRVYSALGVFYHRMGRLDEAVQAFEQASKLTPDNPLNYRNLGGALISAQRYDEARAALQRSIEIKPSAAAYSNLGTAEFFQGRYEQAASAYQEAVRMSPKDYLLWGNLGDAERRSETDVQAGIDASKPAYLKAIELATERLQLQPSAGLERRIALYQAKIGNAKAAQEALDLLPESQRGDAETLFTQGLIYAILDRPDQALGMLSRAVEAGYARDRLAAAPELDPFREDPRFRELLSPAK
ncbi:MAG: tetratricopeptide repeat protein [Acidobacteria bacterium]|nr:tetratricopeptide repeat protein [Acidobacteriota bacterium]